MKEQRPPIRSIVPGMVYRDEAEDATHLSEFFQIEGLAVDTNITLGDLKGTLTEVVQRFFGRERGVATPLNAAIQALVKGMEAAWTQS